jgi:DNA-directed RNA polymerase subunit N
MNRMIPVRCFTCGKVISSLWEEYEKRVEQFEEPAKVLDDLGVERYCCRRMFLTHIKMVDILTPYQ